MRPKLLLHLGLFLVLFSLGACSGPTEGQQGQQTQQEQREEQNERPKIIERTVVKTVEAPERAAEERQAPETEEEQESQDQETQEQQPEETLALQYQRINEGNYDTAYSLFAEQSQQLVSLDEYRAFFENAGYYEITDYSLPAVQVDGETATIEGELHVSSGTNGEEQYPMTQRLVREDGSWRVVMRNGQVATFTGTSGEPDSDIQQPEAADTKQVSVEVSSDVPVDVGIMDDNLDVTIQEEVNGSETYEFTIAADSGLSVSAMSEGMMSGNVSIAVYENGQLVTEDNSSEGYAQVMY